MLAAAIVLLLILVNALFVAAELALVATPRAAVERAAGAGDPRARAVARVLDSPDLEDRYIATAQLGVTAASLGLGMYGEHELAGAFDAILRGVLDSPAPAAHGLASLFALALLTCLHIVLGEMVPKACALARAEQTAYRLVAVMQVIERSMSPVVLALHGLGGAILATLGVSRARGPERFHTPEELRHVVRESEESGLLRTGPANVVDELLAFSTRSAREVMVPRVQIDGLALGASPEEIARIVEETPRTRYPIYAGDLDHVVGCIHIKTLLPLLDERRKIKQADVRPVPFVPGTRSLNDVLRTMREQAAHLVIVMDEHGGTAGLLTIADLFAAVLGHERGTDARADASAIDVEGTERLEELGRRLGLDLAREDVESVSGLVLGLLGRPPEIGDVVSLTVEGERGPADVCFEVLDVEGHGVALSRVRHEPRATPSG